MNFAEGEDSKRYCIKTKHVAIICAVVVAVGLIVGLSVGLTRSCALPEDAPSSRPPTASPPTASTPTASPPQDQGPCPASDDESGAWKNFRLPDFIIPVHYDLEVRPVMEEDTYTGNVTIEINVTKATRHLWLHLRETRISQLPVLRRPSGTQVTVQRCFEYKKQEYVVVEAEEELTPSGSEGLYRLTMNFAGWLNGSLVGFYRTTYVEKGQIKSIAATDHEPTDARKSFPCFDEPNKKATYTISIIHTKDYKALSNMPMVKEESVDDRWTRTTFQKSVPMSTYLVCFAVHQFDYVQRTSKRGIPLTVYVQPEQKHTAEYAANVTKSVFDYFEEYFAMDYALPKLDEIAIPDFGTGAMENWGLITYRETNLLYDPQESASSNKQRVASVVAHELVHQWFGNIVTMEWWEDLWLNEGFASFFEYLGVNHAEGDWQMRDQMLLEDVLPVQEDDSLMSSHPIVITVSNPDEITSAFDGISYSKGASILRMLEDWISPENFQRGCQAYLEKYKFKNAKTSDFWGALEEASNLPVKEVMDTWTTQMGYPVLNVENKRTVMQKRFLLDARADLSQPPSDLGYTWNIPVKWTEDNVSNITFYNRSETRGITLNPSYPSGNAFLKINPDHIGFYRVNYEAQTWDLIATNLNTNPKGFSSADRASLIDDAFALARAQLLDYKVALNLTKYLKMEEDFLPWQRVISAVTYVISMFEDDKELYPMIEEYFRDQVKPVADTLTWNDTGDHLTKLLRASVLGLACKLGDTEALDSASQLFQQWLTGTVRIPVNLRLLVYRYGMQSSGNETSWNYTLDQYQKTSLAQEKEKLLYALASVRNITLLSRHIDCGTKIEYNMISTHEKLKGLYVNSAAHCSKVVYQELDHLDTPQNTALIYYVDGVVLVVPDEKISKYLDALLDSCELKGERYLDLLKDSNLIKTQDVFTVIRYISYNSYGKNMAWNWIQHNWEYLVNRYTLNDRNLGRIVTIAEPFNTELQLWEVESFFKKYPEAGAGETPRQQVLETVRNNIEWVKQNRKSIAEWFGDLPKNGSNILF